MKTLIIALAFASIASCQAIPWRASVTTTVASSGSYSFTVQQAGSNVQNLQTAVISCGTSTFTVGQSQNGTAATTTALTQTTAGTVATSANALVALSPFALQTPLTVTAWTASNVGAGVATSGVTPYSSTAVINLAGRFLASNGTGNNYTFTVVNTGGSSCSLVIDIYGSQAQ